jgi:hypothetical protein
VEDCDRLHAATSDGPLSDFAATCGHRLEEADAGGRCTMQFNRVPGSSDSNEQALVDGCAGDAVDDCDRLHAATSDNPVSDFAAACGHRLEEDDAGGECTVRFNAVPTASEAGHQALVEGCAGDAVDDCDRLYGASSESALTAYARACGHRLEDDEATGDCTVRFNAVPESTDSELQALVDGCAEDVARCDELYDVTNDTALTAYARTCGHRLEEAEATGDCAEA